MHNINLEPKNIFDYRENSIYLQGLMGDYILSWGWSRWPCIFLWGQELYIF